MKCKRLRGFKIKKRVTRFINRIIRCRRSSGANYARLQVQLPPAGSGVLGWVGRKARGLLNRCGPGSGHLMLGRAQEDRAGVPKGHLAVYVEQKEGDCCRVLVPVLYFNHPLFRRLLSEAEEKFGFDYPGRITIPCPVSEFESVTTRIQATVRPPRCLRRLYRRRRFVSL